MGGREYVLFKAAEDVCGGCVRHLIEKEGLDPFAPSRNVGYTAVDDVQWGGQKGKKVNVDYVERLRDVAKHNKNKKGSFSAM